MITRIILENYMSHARTVIEPAAGLTVLVGPNNCGKSAVVSALQTICGDHDGDFMLRHGARSCQVTVETDDGHVVTWKRGKRSVSYVIDGVEVNRACRGNLPDALHEVLRLAKVAHPNGRDEFDVHFGHQKSPIFLIDREGDAAAFFSTASDAQKLLEVQKKHKEKVRDNRRFGGALKEELGVLDGILGALAPLDGIGELLAEAEAAHKELADEQAAAEGLFLLINEVRGRRDVEAYQARRREAIAELQAPPVLHDTSLLEEQLRKVGQAARRVEHTGQRCGSLDGLADPPELEDTGSLTHLGKRLKQADRAAALAAGKQVVLAPLAEPPMLDDPRPIAEMVEKLVRAEQGIGQLRMTMASLDKELVAAEERINAWLWANPTCPTCGAVTTRENVLGGGHSHGPAPAQAKGGRTGG